MKINDDLKILLEMQKLDSEIAQMSLDKNEKPKIIEKHKNDIAFAGTTLKNKEENYKKLQVLRKEKELELQSKEEQVKKLQVQLYQLKTNKEYSAMQLEINKAKADNSLLEEDIIKVLEKIDAAKKEIDDEHIILKKDEEEIKQKISALEAEIVALGEKIKELSSKRGEMAASVKKEVLSRYERIIHGKEDAIGIVEVKNDQCGGCFMVVPAQVINELRMNTKLIVCENCARILYLKEEQNVEPTNN